MKPSKSRLVCIVALIALGCHTVSEDTQNEPPTIRLETAPPQGSTTDYKVHLTWTGSDPDGEIAFYEFTVTDESVVSPPRSLPWTTTMATDTMMVFPADEPADSSDFDDGELEPEEFIRSHTFFVRAVDDKRAESKPAFVSFTARSLSPIVDVLGAEAPLHLVGPTTTFKWIQRMRL